MLHSMCTKKSPRGVHVAAILPLYTTPGLDGVPAVLAGGLGDGLFDGAAETGSGHRHPPE
jgi:hypothetical protein